MASTACFLHHHAPSTTTAHRPLQNNSKNSQFVCNAQKQSSNEEAISRRLALTVLIGGAALGARVSPADAAYGQAANVFGKPKTNTDFLPVDGEGFKMLIPSKWNPSKEVEYPGQVLRYKDNSDSNSNVTVMVNPTEKKSIKDYGAPEAFLSQMPKSVERMGLSLMPWQLPTYWKPPRRLLEAKITTTSKF